MATATFTTVTLRDGRTLEAAVAGEEGAPALLFHHGTPGSALCMDVLVEPALARGWRYVSATRSGYGVSTRDPGRSIGSVVADSEDLLDALSIDRFVAAGWSGGGPHALACAAALPRRCAAAISIAGVAPYLPGEFDWTEGMGEDNVHEFELAMRGGPEYDEMLESVRAALLGVDAAEVASIRDVFGNLVPDADEAAASPAACRGVVECLQRGLRDSVEGFRDDDQAFLRPWGVDLAGIEVPVGIWFGDEDLMVPGRHGEWLSERVPGARRHRLGGEGHFSLPLGHVDDMYDELAAMAGPPW